MPSASRLAAAVALLLAPALLAAQPAPQAPASVVIVRADRVLADAATGQVAPATTHTFSGGDVTVLPGLIDSRVHLTGNPAQPFWGAAVTTPERATATGVANALTTVQAGFTTVRDLGAPAQAGYALRDEVNAGEVPGPRILSAGRMVSIVGGHGDLTGFRPQVIEALDGQNSCTGAVRCAERVRELSRAGADVVKFAATGGVLSQQNRGLDQHFTDDEMQAIVDTAHQLGLKVAAHAHGPRGIEAAAARAGVDSIEHGTYIDEAGIRAMKASGTVLVPTLSPTIAYRENLPRGQYSKVVEAKIRVRFVMGRGQVVRDDAAL